MKCALKELQEVSVACVSGEARESFSTGYGEVDKVIGGLFKKDVVLLAARPGVGKTSMLMEMAKYQARQGHHVLILSLEMSAEALVTRVLAGASEVSVNAIRAGKLSQFQAGLLGQGLRSVEGWLGRVFIEDGKYAMSDIEDCVKGFKSKHPDLSLVMLDYVQLVRSAKKNTRNEEVGDVSSRLKELAKGQGVCVVAAAQMSRAIEYNGPGSNSKREPQLSDLRESGTLEQDADVVMFLTRTEEKAKLFIRKNRNGPVGTVSLHYEGARYKFT